MNNHLKFISSIKSNKLLILGLACGIGLGNLSAYAHEYKGFKFGSANDPFWLDIKGALKLDERLFLGKKQGELHNGASISEFSLNFDGGVGKDLLVTLGLGFNPSSSKVNVEDAYITYTGIKRFGENFRISLGRVNSSFCLENHSSGRWIPFLEKSSVTNAFRPDPGLGVSINKWQDDYSVNASITQPKPNDELKDENGNVVKRSDRLQYNGRVTKAIIWATNKLIQAGIFGHFKDDGSNGIQFSTHPEAKARHTNETLLNTANKQKLIKAKNHYSIGAEFLGQDGPLSGEVEYQFTRVNRNKEQADGNLHFKGYRSNINYVLTGEAREFRSSNGTLGQVIPNSSSGAWEISARYDYLNLNSKNIIGGSAHHAGVAATWYANYNFSTTIEFIRSAINKSLTLEKMHINTIGARLQLVF